MKLQSSEARGAAIAAAALCAMCAAGCAEAPAEMILVVQTDMSLPKDIDTIRIEAFTDGVLKFSTDYTELGTPSSFIRLPATLGLVTPEDNPSASIRIKVSGRQGGATVVVREVVTQVPEGRVTTLHVPLEYLCRGSGITDGEGNSVTTCPTGSSCVAGVCRKVDEQAIDLPDYVATEVFGGGTGAQDGTCLDVAVCFASATMAELDRTSCTLSAPPGEINVAVIGEGEGMCNGRGCFIALNEGGEGGWTRLEDGRIQLPMGACAPDPALVAQGVKPIAGVVTAPVDGACPRKLLRVPTCGPWSSVGSAAPLPENEPLALVSGQSSPTSLALEQGAGGADMVLWASTETDGGVTRGTIKTVLENGGRIETLDMEAGLLPRQVVVADGNPYWVFQDPEGQNNSIRWIDRQDNDKQGSVNVPANRVEGLAVVDGVLFWTDFGSGVVMASTQEGEDVAIQPADLTGEGPAHPFRIVADSAAVCWTNEGTYSAGDGRVVCKRWSRDPATMMPVIDNAMPALEVLGEAAPRGIALDEDGVYWTNFASGEVRWARRMPDGAFGAAETLATAQANPNGIAVDGTALFWTNWGNGTVMRLMKDALEMSPGLIAHAQDRPGAIVVRPDSIYWINEGAADQPLGTLVRLSH